MTITSGLSMFTRLESPTPSARPTVSIASSATGSPSCASSVTNGPVSSCPSSSASPSGVSGRRATRSDASRTSAEPDAITSRQPRLGQLPWHGGPSMSMTMCPSSAPAPIQPRCNCPPSTSPPPIPVPSVSMTTSPEPPPAPWRASASTAQLPSLSTVTGRPSRSDMIASNGTPASGRWVE